MPFKDFLAVSNMIQSVLKKLIKATEIEEAPMAASYTISSSLKFKINFQ